MTPADPLGGRGRHQRRLTIYQVLLPFTKSWRSRGAAFPEDGAKPNARVIIVRSGLPRSIHRLMTPNRTQGDEGHNPSCILETIQHRAFPTVRTDHID